MDCACLETARLAGAQSKTEGVVKQTGGATVLGIERHLHAQGGTMFKRLAVAPNQAPSERQSRADDP